MPLPSEMRLRFTYHPPNSTKQIELHQLVRTHVHEVAVTMAAVLPEGRELSLVLTKLEEAMFHANAGIARFYAENTPEEEGE